ncbi:MAG: ABC transporter permease subunit [Candidatus Electryoneaceae bacterium]|nr:ABC transporter permease subunit [Candidatus Electryoneaceae bacterium]
MSSVLPIFKRELRSYFDSPMAYVVIIVFLLFTGWFFTSNFFMQAQANMRVLFGIVPFVFLFITPAITMRLISEERKSGTIELLVTMPVTDMSIIVGKYLASVALLVAMILPTLVYAITVAILAQADVGMDLGPLIGGYLGLILMGAGYLAIGTFGSSLTENQVVAFIVSWLLVFVFYMMDKVLIFLPRWLVAPIEFMSIEYHFQNISRGVIDSRDLIYYLTLIALALFFAARSLAARRWR